MTSVIETFDYGNSQYPVTHCIIQLAKDDMDGWYRDLLVKKKPTFSSLLEAIPKPELSIENLKATQMLYSQEAKDPIIGNILLFNIPIKLGYQIASQFIRFPYCDLADHLLQISRVFSGKDIDSIVNWPKTIDQLTASEKFEEIFWLVVFGIQINFQLTAPEATLKAPPNPINLIPTEKDKIGSIRQTILIYNFERRSKGLEVLQPTDFVSKSWKNDCVEVDPDKTQFNVKQKEVNRVLDYFANNPTLLKAVNDWAQTNKKKIKS